MNRRGFLGMLASVAAELCFGKAADATPKRTQKCVPHVLRLTADEARQVQALYRCLDY